jgi:hypothetical protein
LIDIGDWAPVICGQLDAVMGAFAHLFRDTRGDPAEPG